MNASEEAARRILERGSEKRPSRVSGATGEYARLRELVLDIDELDDDQLEELERLSEKKRAGTLGGHAERVVRDRRSTAGEREDESPARSSSSAKTASELAAESVRF